VLPDWQLHCGTLTEPMSRLQTPVSSLDSSKQDASSSQLCVALDTNSYCLQIAQQARSAFAD